VTDAERARSPLPGARCAMAHLIRHAKQGRDVCLGAAQDPRWLLYLGALFLRLHVRSPEEEYSTRCRYEAPVSGGTTPYASHHSRLSTRTISNWTADAARCTGSGIPKDTVFATKPELAWRMIERARGAGAPFGWFAGDEVYGDNGKLRAGLEGAQIRYVLAVSCDRLIAVGAGRTLRAGELAARLPKRAWQRLSACPGAKGQRYYDWAWTTVSHPGPEWRWLLIRRHRHTGELAFYRCYAPQPVTLAALVKTAGTRWTTEEHPGQQGPGRPGRAPGPHLDHLAPVGHPGHARRLPGHRRRSRTPARPATRRPDPADPQRGRHSLRQPDHPAPGRPRAPAALVRLARSPPISGPAMPLPAASSPKPMTITIYGWSIRQADLLRVRYPRCPFWGV
jgi:DDE superfamily endonuclease